MWKSGGGGTYSWNLEFGRGFEQFSKHDSDLLVLRFTFRGVIEDGQKTGHDPLDGDRRFVANREGPGEGLDGERIRSI